eukprot:6208763-Pleurochrysis_carterae.AAC.5
MMARRHHLRLVPRSTWCLRSALVESRRGRDCSRAERLEARASSFVLSRRYEDDLRVLDNSGRKFALQIQPTNGTYPSTHQSTHRNIQQVLYGVANVSNIPA